MHAVCRGHVACVEAQRACQKNSGRLLSASSVCCKASHFDMSLATLLACFMIALMRTPTWKLSAVRKPAWQRLLHVVSCYKWSQTAYSKTFAAV